MANIRVKLLEPHYTREGRYLPAGSVVDWDENLINENQIPAPGLGAVTTTAQNKFASVFDAKAAPIPGQPERFKRKNV
jgi:hypothetical protein